MTEKPQKEKVSPGDQKKNTCCAPPSAGAKGSSACCPAPPSGPSSAAIKVPYDSGPSSAATKVSSEWSFSDHIGRVRCRLGSLRNDYRVAPGLYAVGNPDKGSPVFASANYKLSFDILRRSLRGLGAWIVVLDTNGINVWCAAGKSTFGTAELVKRIKETRLEGVVEHRRIIVPQLGAPGVAAHTVQKETGFRVHYGPVEAADIPRYLSSGLKASKDMRMKKFPALDRLILTPMEIRPALKYLLVYALIALGASAIGPEGFDPGGVIEKGMPLVALGALAVFSGAFLTPALLPYIPLRSFALKGLIAGAFTTVAALSLLSIGFDEPLMLCFALIFFPAVSSYLALQFTGSTTFTGISGVRKELRYALPLYMLATAASIVFFTAVKLKEAGIL